MCVRRTLTVDCQPQPCSDLQHTYAASGVPAATTITAVQQNAFRMQSFGIVQQQRSTATGNTQNSNPCQVAAQARKEACRGMYTVRQCSLFLPPWWGAGPMALMLWLNKVI
jgi:hypothetical protein